MWRQALSHYKRHQKGELRKTSRNMNIKIKQKKGRDLKICIKKKKKARIEATTNNTLLRCLSYVVYHIKSSPLRR